MSARRAARCSSGATVACAGAALLSLLSIQPRFATSSRAVGSARWTMRLEAFSPSPALPAPRSPPAACAAPKHSVAALRGDLLSGIGNAGRFYFWSAPRQCLQQRLAVLQLRGGSTARASSIAGRGEGDDRGGSKEGALQLQFRVECVEGTWEIAEAIAEAADAGDVVLLEGQVGAGKTTFARGFVRTFTGDAEVTVASPSFLLHLQYPEGGRCTLHHLDLYRLLPDRDISFLGLEALLPSGVALIEWPSPRLAPLLPPSLLTVRIEEESDGPSQPVASSAAPAAVPLPDSDSAMHAEASLSSAEGGGAGEEGHYGREELPEMDAPRRVTLVASGSKWQAWMRSTFVDQE